VVKFLGNLFLPNAFIPGTTNGQINTFLPKGRQMKSFHLQVFNNFGELIWETTKLDANGSPVEGWDGTFKGTPAQQGVYVWQASATFVDGTEWKGMSYNHSVPKRTGVIHLIR
jgi:large repetitive protein